MDMDEELPSYEMFEEWANAVNVPVAVCIEPVIATLVPKAEHSRATKTTRCAKVVKEKIYKKATIPAAVKERVWDKYIGDTIAISKCTCCKIAEIRMRSFHCGHVKSEAEGGKLTISNMRPICQGCNTRMRTKNMHDYMSEMDYGSFE